VPTAFIELPESLNYPIACPDILFSMTTSTASIILVHPVNI
jgi:hypothetical protein